MGISTHSHVVSYTMWSCDKDDCDVSACPIPEPGPPVGWTLHPDGRTICGAHTEEP